MKLWLDDCRPAPEGWRRAYTADEAIMLLKEGQVQEISLDHDLGDPAICGTGYDVACLIEQAAYDGTLNRITWALHTANPVGLEKMKKALLNADHYWDIEDLGGVLGNQFPKGPFLGAFHTPQHDPGYVCVGRLIDEYFECPTCLQPFPSNGPYLMPCNNCTKAKPWPISLRQIDAE